MELCELWRYAITLSVETGCIVLITAMSQSYPGNIGLNPSAYCFAQSHHQDPTTVAQAFIVVFRSSGTTVFSVVFSITLSFFPLNLQQPQCTKELTGTLNSYSVTITHNHTFI